MIFLLFITLQSISTLSHLILTILLDTCYHSHFAIEAKKGKEVTFFFFWPCSIPISWPGATPMSSSVEAQRPTMDHQESPRSDLIKVLLLLYFGHLMRRADSLEKTLMLGNIEGKRRKGWQRTASLTQSMDMNLSKLQEITKDREAWCPWVTKSRTWPGNWTKTTISIIPGLRLRSARASFICLKCT